MTGGYVLNFTDRTFGEFFRDNLKVDIYANTYNYASGSKANRMRGFWNVASDSLISKSILELIEYIENELLLGNLKRSDFPPEITAKAKIIAHGLDGVIHKSEERKTVPVITEDEFIDRDFKDISLDKLGLEGPITEVLKQRIEEIQKCLSVKAPLAVVFLCGSTLEGILLGIATKYPKKFNQSTCAPKKDGKVLPFHEWTLSSLIDVGRDVGILGEDVKKHSHSLRDFRNYIHPHEQTSMGFSPHEHTAKISWQVLQAAIYEISKCKIMS